MKLDGTNDYYIYEYDALAERVAEVYSEYINILKRDGTPRKDVGFRWFDFKYFTTKDYARLNEWNVLGFTSVSMRDCVKIQGSLPVTF
ncbi:MAG: hypothetical protein KME43_21610 [Myxacorys chilensis ATA2-1-KO14]|jgi:hypothetical protein|nr:hypothetical protein [Myxacorys chilensis ATA2-1-KO14]